MDVTYVTSMDRRGSSWEAVRGNESINNLIHLILASYLLLYHIA